KLRHSPAGDALAEEPRGNHPAVVHHQKIARPQIFRDFTKTTVLDFALTVQNQQATLIPNFAGMGGDQVFRQFIVVIRNAQGVRTPAQAIIKKEGSNFGADYEFPPLWAFTPRLDWFHGDAPEAFVLPK